MEVVAIGDLVMNQAGEHYISVINTTQYEITIDGSTYWRYNYTVFTIDEKGETNIIHTESNASRSISYKCSVEDTTIMDTYLDSSIVYFSRSSQGFETLNLTNSDYFSCGQHQEYIFYGDWNSGTPYTWDYFLSNNLLIEGLNARGLDCHERYILQKTDNFEMNMRYNFLSLQTYAYSKCDWSDVGGHPYPNNELYFSLLTGEYILLPDGSRIQSVSATGDIFVDWNDHYYVIFSGTHEMLPVVNFAPGDHYCCNEVIRIEESIYFRGTTLYKLVEYSSDGQIDLDDDAVPRSDQSIGEVLSEGVEGFSERWAIPVFIGFAILLLTSMANRRITRRLEARLSEFEIESQSQSELLPTEPIQSNQETKIERAQRLFPEWSREQIEEYFENGWSIQDLINWRKEQ